MDSDRTEENLPDLDVTLEKDALWELLQNAPPPPAPPHFVQNTLRRLRADSDRPESTWWHSLLRPKPLLGTATLALAALALLLSLPTQPKLTPDTPLTSHPPDPSPGWEELEEAIASELLTHAAADPQLLTDSELLAILF